MVHIKKKKILKKLQETYFISNCLCLLFCFSSCKTTEKSEIHDLRREAFSFQFFFFSLLLLRTYGKDKLKFEILVLIFILYQKLVVASFLRFFKE